MPSFVEKPAVSDQCACPNNTVGPLMTLYAFIAGVSGATDTEKDPGTVS